MSERSRKRIIDCKFTLENLHKLRQIISPALKSEDYMIGESDILVDYTFITALNALDSDTRRELLEAVKKVVMKRINELEEELGNLKN